MRNKIALKVNGGFVGRSVCQACEDRKEGISFQIEVSMPFGPKPQLICQANSTFYCWSCFQQALSNPRFAIEIHRTVDDRSAVPVVPKALACV